MLPGYINMEHLPMVRPNMKVNHALDQTTGPMHAHDMDSNTVNIYISPVHQDLGSSK
jgi:hypothetical protein